MIHQGDFNVDIQYPIGKEVIVKEWKEMTLRERFDARCLAVNKYARAHKLSQPILSRVLSGDEEIKGTNRSRSGTTRKVFAQLKKDGIWIGPLPWEVSV